MLGSFDYSPGSFVPPLLCCCWQTETRGFTNCIFLTSRWPSPGRCSIAVPQIGYRIYGYNISPKTGKGIHLAMALLEGGNRTELCVTLFLSLPQSCLGFLCQWFVCLTVACLFLIQWFYSPLGRLIAMERMFFEWWSQLLQMQKKKKPKKPFKAALTIFCRKGYVRISEQFPKADIFWQWAAACARARSIKIQCCFKAFI